MSSIFKACDIRGSYGVQLFDDQALHLGRAVACLIGPESVIVAGDARQSTPPLKQSLIQGLIEGGCRAVDIGCVSTPMFYFARRHLGILPGVMVTASHNPPGDNGFKVALGRLPITPDDMALLQDLFQRELPSKSEKRGSHEVVDITEAYVEFARTQATDLNGMRIIVDCANGVASIAAHPIWQATNADVTYLFDDLDGTFPNHPPDPAVEKNLLALRNQVAQEGADLGVAYDGDGDRVAFIDHRGQTLVSDKAIVIFLKRALRGGPAPIVFDQKCSQIVPETIRSLGGEPVMERSGHTFMKTTFVTLDAPYAGELSGHHFFQAIEGDDAIICSLYMAEILAETGAALAGLSEKIPTYPITPDIRLPMERSLAKRVLEQLADGLSQEAELNTLDGIRAEFDDGWGLARLSVTEPAITLRFEGKTESALQRIMDRFEAAATDLSGRLPREADRQDG
jgi:phosphomannomutase/phosphoglucomutase